MVIPRKLLIGLALLAAMLVLAACSGTPAPTTAPTNAPVATTAPLPTTAQQPTAEPAKPALEVPYADLWAKSPHADGAAEAFNHWNEEDPKEVPVTCAKCHSTYGYQDYLGADGSAAGVVDKPAAIGSTVTCVACHNTATLKLTSVTFPSGVEVGDLGGEARCMICHQGRASGQTVTDALAQAALADDDAPSDKLGFTNIHYRAAAATLYAGITKGGYQYEGKPYDAKFTHVNGMDTCIACHSSHSLEVKIDECKTCHTNVQSPDDLKNIRMAGSEVDYNGNGDTDEGIAAEVAGLQDILLQQIQAYAVDVAKTPIAYNADAYPYFFADANANGTVDEGETAYKAWTGRLLKAAYNYQLSIKDPGAFAHNAKYIIELLYDSIDDLNTKVAKPIDMTSLHRTDTGHFNGSDMPFRDWDETGVVPGTCVKCHQAGGLPQFVAEGVTISAPATNGLMCSTCHTSLTDFTRLEIKTVKFPSGATIDSGNPDTNLCISCHQGRESTVSVNTAIKGLEPDTPSDKIRFRNVHYFAAGATLFGTQVKGMYEFADKQYDGLNQHKLNNCAQCHDVHTQTVQVEKCAGCHDGVKTVDDLKTIRMSDVDFNGNGDTKEGIEAEIASMEDALYAAIQAYAKDVAGKPIAYSAESYPYFFNDTNGNGTVDADEAKSDNAYNAWTPRLLTAAYNYQYVQKDPGQFAHNPMYVLQVLYDTLESLNAKTPVAGFDTMVRPEVTAQP